MNLLGLLTETTPSTDWSLSALIEVITTLWTTFIGFIGDTIGLITSHPILLFVMAIPFATIGFSMFSKLLSAVRKVG